MNAQDWRRNARAWAFRIFSEVALSCDAKVLGKELEAVAGGDGSPAPTLAEFEWIFSSALWPVAQESASGSIVAYANQALEMVLSKVGLALTTEVCIRARVSDLDVQSVLLATFEREARWRHGTHSAQRFRELVKSYAKAVRREAREKARKEGENV